MRFTRFARQRTLLAAIVVAVTAAPAWAQSGTLRGTVTSAEGDTALAGVQVMIPLFQRSTTTDTAGHYELADIPAGPVPVEVRRVGFEPAQEVVEIVRGTNRLDVALHPIPVELPELTVIGTPADLNEREERLTEVPGGVALVEAEALRSTRQANLKDVLRLTPGVYIQPRFGAADESQISIRGSGLRNNFHARGVNLLVNGMPYRNADGFTDFESLELLTTQAIEVYKGGNALRYGGSTLGGAINLETKTGYSARGISAYGQGGSFGFYKGQVEFGGVAGGFDWYGSYARTGLEGRRDWSEQSRDRVNLHAGYVLSPTTDLRAFYFFAHVTEQLPGALTESEFRTTPTMANPANVADRWGREYDLHHLGLQLRAQLTPHQRLEISPYVQYRDIDHPIFRVIAQVSRDYGAELRYENTAPIGGRANRFTFGVQPAYLNMDDRQYENEAGQHGALRKDQKSEASSVAFYAEDLLAVTPALSLVAGARWEQAIRRATDFHLDDGDQSDRRVFRPFTPKVGFLYELSGVDGQLFGNVSRSYEPPLLLELNSLTVPGFIELDGQSAWQFELGTRGRRGPLAWDLAVYDVELTNEILNANVQPFPGAGFTVPTYRNAERTRHAGVELGLEYRVPGSLFAADDALDLRLAYTFARYRFVRDSAFAGNDIPGAPPHLVNVELRYTHPSGLTIAPVVEWVPSSYYVNSENTVRNDGWFTLGARVEWQVAPLGLRVFVAGQNLTDRQYSPSVQVDNAAGRYFEPGDGRAVYAGLRWST